MSNKQPDYSVYSKSKRNVKFEMLNKWVESKWYRKMGVAAVNLLTSPSSMMRDARIKNYMNPWTGLRKPFKDWDVNKMSKKKLMGKNKE